MDHKSKCLAAQATQMFSILLWMQKCHEMIQASKLLSKEDVMLLEKVLKEDNQ